VVWWLHGKCDDCEAAFQANKLGMARTRDMQVLLPQWHLICKE